MYLAEAGHVDAWKAPDGHQEAWGHDHVLNAMFF
jgi:predicted lipoprotein